MTIYRYLYGYGSIPIDTFLVGWTSIYQLFWCSPGVQGFDTLPYHLIASFWYVSIRPKNTSKVPTFLSSIWAGMDYWPLFQWMVNMKNKPQSVVVDPVIYILKFHPSPSLYWVTYGGHVICVNYKKLIVLIKPGISGQWLYPDGYGSKLDTPKTRWLILNLLDYPLQSAVFWLKISVSIARWRFPQVSIQW